MRRLVTSLALAVVAISAAARPAHAQPFPFNAFATQYTFSGCDAHLCTVLTFLAEPTGLSRITGGPNAPAQYIDFSAVHTFLTNADGLGVIFNTGVSHHYDFAGVPLTHAFDGDSEILGGACQPLAFWIATNSGSCLDDGTHSGTIFREYTPTTAVVTYGLAPAGLNTNVGIFQWPPRQYLTLQLTAVGPITTPEPATLALVGGGLLLIGAAARRRASTIGR